MDNLLKGNSYLLEITVNLDPKTYDFVNDWCPYWKGRLQVYYHKDLRIMIDKIGENYRSTVGNDVTSESDDSSDPETFSLKNSSTTPDSKSVHRNNNLSSIPEEEAVFVIGKNIYYLSKLFKY